MPFHQCEVMQLQFDYCIVCHFFEVNWYICLSNELLLCSVQMNDTTFVECCQMIANCLSQYQKQPTRTPRLRLSWSVSRRTLHKMRPSTRAAQDLEPIMEDESLRTSFSNDENYSSPFDRYSVIDSNSTCHT